MAGTLLAPAFGGLIELTSGDSLIGIDPDSSAGVHEWNVGNTSYLSQQWFWFRADIAGLDDREYPINALDATPDVFQHAAIPGYARLTYASSDLEIQITYILVGGFAIRASDCAEIIKITNNTDDFVTLNFYQYSDFDLGGDLNDDEVRIAGGNTSFQVDFGTPTVLMETIVSRSPDLSETGDAAAILAKLEDGDPDDLDGTTYQAGPADLAWAFQWQDREIEPGGALLISKDKVLTSSTAIPEPATVAGLGGLLVAGWWVRRRRRT